MSTTAVSLSQSGAADKLPGIGDDQVPIRKNLGLIEELEVITYGEPGQRVFNITATSRHGTGVVWLEKEQLFDIASSLLRAAEIIGDVVDPNVGEDDDLGDSDDDDSWDEDTVEFKAWIIEMGYDDDRKLFRFAAGGTPPDADLSEMPDESDFNRVWFMFSHHQAVQMSRQGMDIVRAGRPLCVYCGGSLDADSDHLCPRRNGHNPEEARHLRRI